ncbi:MAG TPA: DUF2335 domain-containing protein [Rickettsiales bacterium]|nr:DUF2335 domain-containing protein [Rickettsiales bacterium]
MNNIQEKKETLLPPPELLERYENISKGLCKDLVELIKKEQTHRHKLQDKYLMNFRIGQIFGAAFLIYIITMIFELAKNGFLTTSYIMAGLFGVLILLVLSQYKRDRSNGFVKNNNKNFNRNHKRHFHSRNNQHNIGK